LSHCKYRQILRVKLSRLVPAKISILIFINENYFGWLVWYFFCSRSSLGGALKASLPKAFRRKLLNLEVRTIEDRVEHVLVNIRLVQRGRLHFLYNRDSKKEIIPLLKFSLTIFYHLTVERRSRNEKKLIILLLKFFRWGGGNLKLAKGKHKKPTHKICIWELIFLNKNKAKKIQDQNQNFLLEKLLFFVG
jgi:hypothetical protein